ncbi:hypothetical protein [Micromonospora sp. NPDC005173]|uniref:hypothetical protein n=1 Tax=Micromonospora sp. NPDC005173 TaxID=3157165 RepID=UPI0033BFA870
MSRPIWTPCDGSCRRRRTVVRGSTGTLSANAEADWETEDKAPELEGTSPVLINWGVDATADMLCWDASDGDPAKWPVVVYKRNGSLWSRYDCGMVEFLVRVLRADFPECPLGGLFLWGVSEAAFEKRGG